MAITKYDDIIKAATTAGKMQNSFFFDSGVHEVNGPMAKFMLDGFPALGAAPSTNRVCTKDTAGAIYVGNPTGENAYYVGASLGSLSTANHPTMLVDRLVDTTGLSGTVITAQTTNLPTPALTRYTDGKGVLIGLQCWGATGTTAVNVTCSYTNQDGTTGRTSPSVAFWTGNFGGGTLGPTGGQVQILPFQAGDYGCRAVASVTLSASTLTAGSFGVVLLKPIAIFEPFALRGNNFDFVLTGCMEQKIDNACLDTISQTVGSTATIYGMVHVLYA